MEKTFNLIIQTPEKEVFNGKASSVAVDLDGGRVVVMSSHASMIGTVSFGSMEVKVGETTEKFLVRQGLLNFDNQSNTCRIMAYYCEMESEISIEDAQDYLNFIEEKLAEGENLSEFQINYLESEKIAVSKQVSK